MFWKRLVDLGNREGVKLPVPRRFKMAGFRWPQMAGFDLAPEEKLHKNTAFAPGGL